MARARPATWAALTALAAVASTSIGDATAATTPNTHSAPHAATDIGQALAQAWQGIQRLAGPLAAPLETGMARAPALVLASAIVLAVPVLALFGLLLSRSRAHSSNGRAGLAHVAEPDGVIETTRSVTEGLAWPADALLTIDGEASPARRLGRRELLRIGRDDDNDLCLTHPTVHRYHAVLKRTPESDFIIVDLSAQEGNGVLVNGKRVAQARLRDGDVIGLGEMRLRFQTLPA